MRLAQFPVPNGHLEKVARVEERLDHRARHPEPNIFVAFLGIINSLNALITERQRDIGILRAIGGFRKQVQKTVLIEAGMIGFFSHLLGLIAGFLLSLLLIYVINKQSFGWTIQFSIPLWSLIEFWLIVMVTSTLAGFFPARRAAKMNAVEALRME